MANSIVVAKGIVAITDIDSDWTFGREMRLISIDFIAAQAADHCMVRAGGIITGAVIFDMTSAAVEPLIKYFDGLLINPCVDFSEGTYTATSMIIFTHAGW